nr:MAG TPA: hypothetical protein [Caudoviricetes sp.]
MHHSLLTAILYVHAISVALFLWGFGVRHSGLVLFAPGRLCVLGYTCCSCY